LHLCRLSCNLENVDHLNVCSWGGYHRRNFEHDSSYSDGNYWPFLSRNHVVGVLSFWLLNCNKRKKMTIEFNVYLLMCLAAQHIEVQNYYWSLTNQKWWCGECTLRFVQIVMLKSALRKAVETKQSPVFFSTYLPFCAHWRLWYNYNSCLC
jgi:hypothetical protein